MKTSENGIKFLKGHEGLELKPYLDIARVPTIGFGNTFYANGQPVTMDDKPITEEQAERLMRMVLVRFENAVNDLVKVDINQNQFDALVSLTYNIGITAFRESTLLERLNAGLYKDAANQFQWWRMAGGKVIQGLVNRRAKEKVLFLMAVQQEEKQMLTGYKTYIGIAITILGSLSSLFGWELGDLAGLQDQVISIVGALIAIYGRYVAKADA